MLVDKEIGPFLGALYARVDESFREGPGKATGGGLGEFLALFEGEVAFAVAPRRNEPPGIVLLADTVSRANREAVDVEALERGRQRIAELIDAIRMYSTEREWRVADEQIAGINATVIRPGSNARRAFGYVERDGVLITANDPLLLESILLKWDAAQGNAAPGEVAIEGDVDDDAEVRDDAKRVARLRRAYAAPLSENEGFTESLRECVGERLGGGDESPPQLIGFVDPLGIFRAVAQENAGARLGLATLPILGIDRVEGVAAAFWINEGDWESLFRAHLLLGNPRAGILKMARLLPCDPTPVDAIPADVSSYACGAVDLAATLAGASQLYDRIRGEGRFAEDVESRVTKTIGVPPAELVGPFTGRFVSLTGYGAPPAEGPPRVNPARALLLEAEDIEAALRTARGALEKAGVKLEEREHRGVAYLVLADVEALARRQRDEGPRPGQPPTPLTAIAPLGKDLVLCETVELLEQLIATSQGDGDRLADHLPYRLTASRAQRLGVDSVGGEEGRLVTYEDPGAQFRQWHAAGSSDAGRTQLDQLAEFAPPLRWLRDALAEAGVPSLEALERFAVPSGGAVFDTPRGFRYVAFSFKVEEPDE